MQFINVQCVLIHWKNAVCDGARRKFGFGSLRKVVDSQKMGQVISIFRFCSSGSFGHVCESVRLLCWLVERVQNEQGRLLEVDVQGSFHEAHGSNI